MLITLSNAMHAGLCSGEENNAALHPNWVTQLTSSNNFICPVANPVVAGKRNFESRHTYSCSFLLGKLTTMVYFRMSLQLGERYTTHALDSRVCLMLQVSVFVSLLLIHTCECSLAHKGCVELCVKEYYRCLNTCWMNKKFAMTKVKLCDNFYSLCEGRCDKRYLKLLPGSVRSDTP